ncbi:hypothetical protein CVT24_002138 [Panaeolus cyanescens]|uniref:GPI inositol-deacylase n=1 Tax=Panaeolus cyanescens TaxID=181874 RepID=A0A409YI64_9AGAR|nr:hypothetical protein CVT24_002138 [Panaeolus cyanescens]
MFTNMKSLLAIFSVLAVFVFYLAANSITQSLSPQGCLMSYMSPSYVLQTDFNATWTPLAARYSLWLYREVGWDSIPTSEIKTNSLPVLFIPGNAGSSRQVRSIASSAARQFYSSPGIVSSEFTTPSSKSLDVYAVEFNEDFSAFHGSTLESQVSYTSKAISFILATYPAGTKVVVMGHSMGGIVATSLLPSEQISEVITMSTPHTLPPARFDSRVDALYTRLQGTLLQDPTPILSICGGATDLMIPSESCILPPPDADVYRSTVFTSSLEGAWTGVGHQEMVWCHQVRWRIARAALELSRTHGSRARTSVLDKWLRDGHTIPQGASNISRLPSTGVSDVEFLNTGKVLQVDAPWASKTYLLPVGKEGFSDGQKVTVMVSQGSILGISPLQVSPLDVSVLICDGSSESPSEMRCDPLVPDLLKLLPSPTLNNPFPVPQKGSDESEGVVLFEHRLKMDQKRQDPCWVAVQVKNADGRGWVAANVVTPISVAEPITFWSLLLGPKTISIPMSDGLEASISFPSLFPNALVVYSLLPQGVLPLACEGAKFLPLIAHVSHDEEAHYYPLINQDNHPTLLHTHWPAPMIDAPTDRHPMVRITLYTVGKSSCRTNLPQLQLRIDWLATLGRCASRYFHSLVAWSAGVVSVVIFLAWKEERQTGFIPSVDVSLERYSKKVLPWLSSVSLILSLVPIPSYLYLGNGGKPELAFLGPLLLCMSSGLVIVSWWFLQLTLNVLGYLGTIAQRRRTERGSVPKTTLASLLVISSLIFLLIPWQVAYLGCWLLHLHTCASALRNPRHLKVPADSPVELDTAQPVEHRDSNAVSLQSNLLPTLNTTHHYFYTLLLMTWLLPLTAPILAVWVRTLLTAGFTTPFDGDHNFVAVLPFLILVDFASWNTGQFLRPARFEQQLSLSWLFVGIAGTAFLYGSRHPYYVLDMARIATWIIIVFRIGRRYWSSTDNH